MTFPPLENGHQPLKSALDLLQRYGSVKNVVNSQQEAPGSQKIAQSGYLEKYFRARAAVKHHVIMTEDGTVEPLDAIDAPNDVHEFIGQRFPDELYFYLSRGVIGPEVLNMLASGELIEVAPLDNDDSEEYQKFLLALVPIRTQALSLLAQPLYRFWHSKEVSVYYWWDPKTPQKLVHKEVQPTPYEATSQWHVKGAVFRPALEKSNVSFPRRCQVSQNLIISQQPIGLTFTVSSLADADYAASTKTTKNDEDVSIELSHTLFFTNFIYK